MQIRIKITSPVRALSLELDTSTNQASLNGQQVKLNTNFYANKISKIVAQWQKGFYAPTTDGESYLVEIEGKRYEGNNHPEGYDQLVALLSSLS